MKIICLLVKNYSFLSVVSRNVSTRKAHSIALVMMVMSWQKTSGVVSIRTSVLRTMETVQIFASI